MKRRKVSDGKRAQVFAMTAGACYYCGYAAEDVEHITPYAYSADNGIGNLVPSCSICNSIAGSNVFASLQEKKEYILAERASLKWRRKLSRMIKTIVNPSFDIPKKEKKKKVAKKSNVVRIKTKKQDSPRDTQARKWLARAHRSFRSWARVAQVVGLTSKGQAQHIAEGRAPVPSNLLMALDELQAYRQAARWLAARQITE